MRWWLSAFQMLFTTLQLLILFASFKLLTKILNAYWNPQNSLLCDWSMFFSADFSLVAEKMRKNQLVTGSLQYDFTESQAYSCNPWVFEVGYWKEFKISK